MKQIAQVLLLLLAATSAHAANYYVDCIYGANGNDGQTAPWRTPLKIGLHSFSPGDAIHLRRDCTWNEGITLVSSGESGNPITIDAFGQGLPPHLTGYLPIGSGDWSQWAGDVWVTKPLYSSTCAADRNCVSCWNLAVKYSCLDQEMLTMNYVRFGTVWGQAQASVNALTQDRDWFFDAIAQELYVYSASGNPVSHYGQVAPIAISGMNFPASGGSTMLKIQGANWVQVQHLAMDWFDTYGVQVVGPVDHLWLANLAANSMVENGAVPLGFYLHPDGGPTDVHLFNTDANMNYQGYRFEYGNGTTTGLVYDLRNCRAYGNRAYGIVDNVGGAVTYDYCHLYGNNLATALEVDTSGTPGPTPGQHNVAALKRPYVREWHRWPAYMTLTYDDPGLVPFSAPYIESLRPMLQAKGIPLSVAVVSHGASSQQDVGQMQEWIAAGIDINAHSVSHEYWNPPSTTQCDDVAGPIPCEAFKIRYTGNIAQSVIITIMHDGNGRGTFAMTPTPFDAAAYHLWDLTPVPPGGTAGTNQIDTVSMIVATLKSSGVFSIDSTTLDNSFMKGNAHAIALADVANLEVVAASQQQPLFLDETYLESDEIGWTKQWLSFNLTGLPANLIYIMPGTYEDPTTEGIVASFGYKGARGSGSLRPCCGADTTLAKGYDVFNILSQGVAPNLQNLSYGQLRDSISADTFKNALWGRPVGLFWHVGELPTDQVANMVDALQQSGATLRSNTQLVNSLLACKQNHQTPSGYVTGSYYVCPGNGKEADFRPTTNSPTRTAGANLGSAFQMDIMGVNRDAMGSQWDIGAYEFVPAMMGRTIQ